jgi:hypothetical protein
MACVKSAIVVPLVGAVKLAGNVPEKVISWCDHAPPVSVEICAYTVRFTGMVAAEYYVC